MSLKKIEQVKADKGFKIWDLIIYGIVLVLVAVLFTVVITTRNTDPLTGVRVTYKAETVLEYEFGGQPEILDEMVEVKEDVNGLTVTVRSQDDFNVIYIDKSAKTVKMQEANCKGKQCLYFAAIKNNSGYIICDPHGIKIEPLIKSLDGPDIIM